MKANTITRVTNKTKAWAILIGIVTCVALPQVLHYVGVISGMGPALGATFLPMHLGAFLTGLVAGPLAGIVVGAASPFISYAFSGMPTLMLLPFMMVELAGYGLFSGLLRDKKMPVFGKVVVAQVGGRVLRAVCVVVAIYFVNVKGIGLASIYTTITEGLMGILLQWAFIPLIMYRVNDLRLKRGF